MQAVPLVAPGSQHQLKSHGCKRSSGSQRALDKAAVSRPSRAEVGSTISSEEEDSLQVTQNKNKPVSEVNCNKTVLGMKWEASGEGRLMPAS